MFCKKCKSILMPTKVKDKTILLCRHCGDADQKAELKLKDTVKQGNVKYAGVVEEEKEAYPLIEFSGCKKCGHKKAYFWTVQTRASDEPETKFYKCENCKSVTRDYS